MTTAELEALRDAVDALQIVRRPSPVVVALDGRSGSGKSTLAAQLATELGSAVVSGDDFYRAMDESLRWELGPRDGVRQYFDWQRLREEAIVPLRRGLPARYHPFNWAAHTGYATAVVEIAAHAVVTVDGVYSGRAELADLVDLAVLVETDELVRHQRLLRRGQFQDQWHSRWEAAEDLYFSALRPASSFDLVINGAS